MAEALAGLILHTTLCKRCIHTEKFVREAATIIRGLESIAYEQSLKKDCLIVTESRRFTGNTDLSNIAQRLLS